MSAEVPRLFVFARHAESTANTAHALSSDPARPAGRAAASLHAMAAPVQPRQASRQASRRGAEAGEVPGQTTARSVSR
jgi:hypothetical protein